MAALLFITHPSSSGPLGITRREMRTNKHSTAAGGGVLIPATIDLHNPNNSSE
jgi:hypothetical protein